MKKAIFLLAVVAANFTLNAQNLVQNPGFETGTLTPWAKGVTASYIDPTVSSANSHSGNYGVGYTPTATTGFFQDIAVNAGTTYTASFWYKATGDATDARIWSNFKDASGSIIYLNSDSSNDPLRGPSNGYLPSSASWTQHTVTFTVPTGASVFTFAVRAYTSSSVSFDDFSLTSSAFGTVDFSNDKFSLVKYTSVKNEVEFAKDAKVSIYNSLGQMVAEQKVRKDSSMDISSLPAGVYYVNGIVNGEKVSQKILKK